MNMVKRIMGRPRQEECSPQDNALGLMHLRRLFSELCHPPRHMTQKEQEEKLYMMLPVFNRVFGNAPPNTMNEKFSDLLQFTTQVSRLMVTEIRRRASNKSTEAASRAIVQFLEVNQSEEASRGWMLLTTINLLASSGQKTVDCMTTMSVPSTLVKCLYLFFDLPHMPEVPAATQTELPLADRRALLQKVFVQILVKLCSYVSPAEELAQKDDLQLLFSAITSWCPPHNLPWRKSAGEVLTTISRHGLSVNVVKYIHEKECLSTCIQNMQQSDDLSPLEIVEMFAGLSCFLKDSSDVSQALLDDFRMCQGYTFLVDLMIRLEQAKEDESKDALKDLVNLVTALTTYGVSELKPAGLTTGAPFLLPGFVVPQPSGKGHTVRNIQAFSVLQNAFLKAKSGRLARMILEAIANIYAADYANYFILEAQHTLSQFAERVAKLPEVQSKYFELLEFVVFGLNYVPCKELFSVSVLLKSSTSYGCSITATRTLLKLGRHHPVFSEVFREVGLLEVLVNLLHKYAALLKDPTQAHDEQGDAKNNVAEEQKQLAWLVMETLTVLLQGSNTNAGLFREFGGARCVHNIVKYRQCREHALMIIQQLVLSSSGDDDMGTLLGLMHSAPSAELQLKTDILRVRHIYNCVKKIRTNCLPLLLFLISLSLVTSGIAWLHTRGVCGMDLLLVFVWLCECLVCLHVDCLVVTLCVRLWLNRCSRAEQVPPCLTHETSLPSPWGTPAIARKRYCFLPPLPFLPFSRQYQARSAPQHALDLQLAVANILQLLVHSERNQQILCEAGLHSRLLQRCSCALGDEDHPLHPPLQRMFERLASQALEPMVLREFLRLGNPLNCGAWDKKLLKQYRVHKPSSLSYEAEMRNSMTLSMEGFGPDSVFTINEDNSQYRISRSLVRSAEGSTVPLTRVKCLVSMTTPHDIHLHGSSVTPAFVEFDTSLEGFGCLFLPSLAPHNVLSSNANTSGVSDGAVVSGMGNGMCSQTHSSPTPVICMQQTVAFNSFSFIQIPCSLVHCSRLLSRMFLYKPKYRPWCEGAFRVNSVPKLQRCRVKPAVVKLLSLTQCVLVSVLSEAAKNAKLLREFQLIPRLLLTLRDQSLSQPTIAAIGNVLSLLLQGFPNSYDLLRFGQFISSTLPTFAVCEKFVIMENTNEEKIDRGAEDEFGGLLSSNLILLRNRLLDILLKQLFTCKEKNIVNVQACEELVRTLGFDWLLMFMEEHIHSSTVTAALLILVVLLSNQSILSRFKEGLSGGGWLDHTDSVLTNKIGTVLGFNVGRSAGGRSTLREINRDACHFPGFPVLQTLLPKHTNVPEIYFMLMALFLQQPITELPDSLQVHFDLDSIWTFIFGVPSSSATVVGSIHNMCTEAAFLLLAMLRSMLNLPWQSEEEGSWLREYPITLMQFFRYLYHNIPDLAHMWHSPDFLCTLAATVFPFNIRPYSEMVSDLDDEASSPTEEFKAFVTDTGMNRSQSEYCNVGNKTYLTNHPAKKYVFDFMRVLIMDNLCMTPASKQTPIIDLLLEASPERSTRTQQKEFQSYILDSVMEQLLAADVLLGEEASLPITTGGSYQVLVNNVFYFTQRVVDKLWQGMFNKESKLVVDFIVQLITQSKRRSQGLSLDSVYHCLNRTILYQLSRPHKTVPQQVTLLDSLRVLTVNRNLVLGPGNHDQEFVACLAHCLINLHTGSSVEGFGLEAEARMTTWHVAVPSENKSDHVQSQDVSEGRQLLLKAVNRVWTELMHSKRQMLEDIFKVSLPVNDRGHVDIATARPALEEPAAKSWQNHLVHEKKCISRGETVAPANQSKLSRVSSGFGLSKLTGSRRSKKESGMNKNNLSAQETFQWMFTHIAVVRDLVAMQYKEHQERQQNALKYVMDEWAGIEYELLRERGLWGPPIGSHLDKFQLDMTEGPCRMRKKMVRNDMFYIHYPYVPDPEPNASTQVSVLFLKISEDFDISQEEIFNSNLIVEVPQKKAYFFTHSQIMFSRFLAVVPSLADSSESVSGQRPNTSVEQGSGLLSTLVGEKSVTQRWERGEISNFQYLMHLNTLAGRSYNDLMQYPVFPWILADFDSEELDLNNPKTFRNLSKPMGAQTDDRLIQYKKRFKDWEDPNGESETPFNNPLLAVLVMLRLFKHVFVSSQGGHFDLADRMFNSIREAWLSASKHNMADVKELIPEFFYLPEFLLNSNNFDLGSKQNGTKLGDVILPPWAKGDPREFIRVHREALECDYVSAHLHEWIDLIFGYKQQGPPAVEAVNVFHHLFYEGQVDIYNINDPLKETATIGFINNFGQIPKQLFKKPHPPKRVRSKSNGEVPGVPVTLNSSLDKIFFHHLDNLRPSLTPVKELKEPVGQIVCTDKGILAVEQNKVLVPPAWNKTFAWGYADLSCRLSNYESDKAVVVYECLSEWGQILCAICPNPKLVITGGLSTAICVWETGTSKEKAKSLTLKQALLGHTDAVTYLTASSAYHIIVSGSRDRTCIIWDLNKLSFVTQLRGHRAPVSALCINELTGDIVSCAGTYIHVWSINGSPIASANTFTGRSQQILCCCISEMNEWDTQNVIVTGHSDGVVRFWRIEFLQVPETPAPEPVEPPDVPDCCGEIEGRDAPEDDSSESEGEETSLSQDPKPLNSQPSSTVHRPKPRTGASWSVDSSSDDSRRWSDTLSIDEKDGFVFVNYSEGQIRAGIPSQPHLQPWERQLVFRSKLTMHTAFDRKDNAHPAEITSLAISKDHSKILVGDSSGRVFSWSVSDQPGRSTADHWVKDEQVDSCSGCTVRFSLTERRHHCRNCGQVFCQKCSRFQSEIKRLKISSPVRVCQNCYYNLQHERGSEESPRN
uniref:WD repeat and FYVE domain containing 3 n=1 Tax=Sinocyclocheilus grahami TaxID=75366 RepID=A0A672QYC5_SINGR